MSKNFKRFGEFLRSFRQIRGLRQKELAKVLGCSPSVLCHLEKGRREPSRQFLERLLEMKLTFKQIDTLTKIVWEERIRITLPTCLDPVLRGRDAVNAYLGRASQD